MPGTGFYPGAMKVFKTQAKNVVLRSGSTKLGRHVTELRTEAAGGHLTWKGGAGLLENVPVDEVTSALGVQGVSC